MNKIKTSSAMFIAVLSIIILGLMCLAKGIDTSIAISSIALGLAGSRAFEAAKAKPKD